LQIGALQDIACQPDHAGRAIKRPQVRKTSADAQSAAFAMEQWKGQSPAMCRPLHPGHFLQSEKPMALHKPIEIRNTGHIASYWRLTHCQVDHAAEVVEFRLHGYPNEAARKAGKAPLPVIPFRLTAQQLGVESLHTLATAALYEAARTQPAEDGTVWFADADSL
jgi:hypothetical protein